MGFRGLALRLAASPAFLSACGGSDADPDPGLQEGMSCTLVADAVSCTNGEVPEIYLGPATAEECRPQCEVALEAAGVTSGCWILASNTHCYCRSGSLNTGGSWAGGTCSSRPQ